MLNVVDEQTTETDEVELSVSEEADTCEVVDEDESSDFKQ
jgi:hypothetical protein